MKSALSCLPPDRSSLGGGQRRSANLHRCTIYCSVCVCLRGKLFVWSLSVSRGDFTAVIWLPSSAPCFSPISLLPAVEIFRDLKQSENQTLLHRQTHTPSSLFSTDCTHFRFHVSFLSCSISVRVFHFIHCTWLQWFVP